MKSLIKRFWSDDNGSAFIENGLWIIIVVLLVAGAGYVLANQGIKAKFDDIQEKLTDVDVPDIG